MLRVAPSCGRLVLTLIVEFFNEYVFDGRPYIGESPADMLVMALRLRKGVPGKVTPATSKLPLFRCAANQRLGIW